MDSMCRQMSTKAGCRHWPLAVFWNILEYCRHQCMDLIEKVDEFGDTMAAVLVSAVCGTENNIDVIRKHASFGVNLVIFKNDSTWKTSQLSVKQKRRADATAQPQSVTAASDQFVASVWQTFASSAMPRKDATDCAASNDACGCSRYICRPHSVTRLDFLLIFHKRVLH